LEVKMRVILLLLMTAGAVHADALNDKIASEVAAQNVEAGKLFVEASDARSKGDLERAVELFKKVEALLPSSAHALRRHAGVLLALKRRDEALPLAETAYGLEQSPLNAAALADILLATPDHVEQQKNLPRALKLARSAADKDSGEFTLTVWCQAELLSGNAEALERCAERLRPVQRETFNADYFIAMSQAMRGDFDDALESLDRAHAAGFPDEAYVSLRAKLRQAAPLHQVLLKPALRVGGLWIAGMATLFVLGVILSRLTLARCERKPASRDGHARGGDALLHRLYAAVIGLSCGYYYLSIPLVIALVVLVGGGVIYAMFAVGQIPVKLVFLVGIFVFVTVAAALRSLFLRPVEVDPGMTIDLGDNPKLRSLLEEVAGRVGTRQVDTVYLTPGTDLAVIERGRLLTKLRGRGRRCLILGAAVLPGFRLRAFRAVLAHEYGHFINRDTAGGWMALAVRRSLYGFAVGLIQSGAAAWYNPAWWFVRGFERAFLRISLGASRLQEVLADRWAASAYGARAIEEGLCHAIEADFRFGLHCEAVVKDVTEQSHALSNLYRHDHGATLNEAEIAQNVAAAIEREGSPYQSHPPPKKRIAWVEGIVASTPPSMDDELDAWTLFSDGEKLQCLLTDDVRQVWSSRTGVDIAAG
jgi:Zn-dependent protease with chaperone function